MSRRVTLTVPWLAAIGAVVSLGLTDAHASASESDTVRLQFAWQAGMVARVEYEGTRMRVRDGQAELSGSVWRWKLVVGEMGDLLTVRTDSMQYAGASPLEGLDLQVERLAAMTPVILVSRSGDFVGLHDVAAYRAGMLAYFDSLAANTPDVPSSGRRAMESMLTTAVLEGLASESWSSMAGAWTLGDLELGETYAVELSLPSPIMPELALPLRVTYRVIRRATCDDESSGCVEMSMEVRPDSAKTTELIAKFLSKHTAADSSDVAAATQGMTTEQDVSVTIRPHGLLPHRVVGRKRIYVRGSLAQQDVKIYRFTWTTPGP